MFDGKARIKRKRRVSVALKFALIAASWTQDNTSVEKVTKNGNLKHGKSPKEVNIAQTVGSSSLRMRDAII